MLWEPEPRTPGLRSQTSQTGEASRDDGDGDDDGCFHCFDIDIDTHPPAALSARTGRQDDSPSSSASCCGSQQTRARAANDGRCDRRIARNVGGDRRKHARIMSPTTFSGWKLEPKFLHVDIDPSRPSIERRVSSIEHRTSNTERPAHARPNAAGLRLSLTCCCCTSCRRAKHRNLVRSRASSVLGRWNRNSRWESPRDRGLTLMHSLPYA